MAIYHYADYVYNHLKRAGATGDFARGDDRSVGPVVSLTIVIECDSPRIILRVS